MLNNVLIDITSQANGFVGIVPFNESVGLMTRKDKLGQTWMQVYKVPAYVVSIQGGDSYLAVRFGLVNHGKWPPAKTRRCDAGLALKHTYTPSWNSTYGTQTLRGLGSPGAWVLMPGRGFYIHRGADRPKRQFGGSLGCVEILDGKWDAFLTQIQDLGNGSCAQLGGAGKVKVTVHAGSYPTATWIGEAAQAA
jgi:hypothetical protein